MEKLGRKPSSDPVQEKLRQTKALWNKDVSMFINDLIHLKKTMNGWPSKFYQERSTIKEPVPADPGTIIGSLADDFQQLVQRGNAIVEEQLNYAKTRRKKQPKQMNLPFPPAGTTPPSTPEPPKPDLTQQLNLPHMASSKSDLIKLASELEEKYDLTSEASNPFSRFWFRATNPRIGWGRKAELRRTRRAMLAAAVSAFKGLEKFQVMIVKSSPESIDMANRKLHECWNELNTVIRTFADFQASIAAEQTALQSKIKDQDKRQNELEDSAETGGGVPPEGKLHVPDNIDPSKEPKEKQDSINARIQDYLSSRDALRSFETEGNFNKLDAAIDVYKASRGRKLDNKFMTYYFLALVNIMRNLDAKNARSFADLALVAAKKAATPPAPITPDTSKTAEVSLEIEKVAQDFLKKWIGKTKHHILTNDTSDLRLRCYRRADDLRTTLDKIMDEIQKGLDSATLPSLLNQADDDMIALRGMMRNLYLFYQKDKRKEQEKQKKREGK